MGRGVIRRCKDRLPIAGLLIYTPLVRWRRYPQAYRCRLKTDAQRRAQANYAKSLADKGIKPITLRVSERVRNRLRELAKSHGSQSRALENILGGD